MRFALSALALLLLIAQAPAPPPDPNAVAKQIRDATQLVDSGHAAEAVAALQKIVAANPGNKTAHYELGLAYAANGNYKECRATMEPLSAAAGELQIGAIAMLANCLDQLGEREKAIETYRRGLKIAPDDSSLNFNLAVSLAQSGKLDEARQLLKNDTTKNPWHASGHLILAHIFEAQHFTVPAIFAYLHFIALEPATQRTAAAAQRVHGLLNAGITKTKEGANITVDTSAPKDEGDYSATTTMIALLSAGRMVEDSKESEFERAQGQVALLIGMFTDGKDEKPDYTTRVQQPFFTAIANEKLTDVLAALAVAPLKLKGTEEWAKKHEADVDRYAKWMAPQTRPAAVQLTK